MLVGGKRQTRIVVDEDSAFICRVCNFWQFCALYILCRETVRDWEEGKERQRKREDEKHLGREFHRLWKWSLNVMHDDVTHLQRIYIKQFIQTCREQKLCASKMTGFVFDLIYNHDHWMYRKHQSTPHPATKYDLSLLQRSSACWFSSENIYIFNISFACTCS